MNTKFQDVAHYYLGCKLIHKWSDRSESEPITLDANRLKLGVNDWKPILRDIQDMTEDEAVYIAKISLFNNYHGFVPRCEKYKDRWVVYAKSNFEGDKVEILFYGDICRWVNGEYSSVPLEMAYEIIPYLLTQGIDIFHLIANNEAVK
jgi:hypothetical protein